MCAGVCQWDARAKLLNLVTRLKGAAYSFYKSCSVQHRSDYGELVKAVYPGTYPSGTVFHDRKLLGKESVDDFSQDLRKLFAHAYTKVEQWSREAEAMGKSVLANQFIAGLRLEIKGMVVGMEGSFEELLVKARFEEAKLRDLAGSGGEKSKKVSGGPVEAGTSRSGSGSSIQQSIHFFSLHLHHGFGHRTKPCCWVIIGKMMHGCDSCIQCTLCFCFEFPLELT